MKLYYFILILSIFQLTACSGPEYPEFQELKNAKFKSVGFLHGASVTFNADAIFYNPNPIGAKVTEVDLDLYIDDKKVTHINQDVSAVMKANSNFTLPLSFDIDLKDLFKDGKSALGGLLKTQKIQYKMKGTLKVGVGSIEIAVPVEYEGEEEIKL